MTLPQSLTAEAAWQAYVEATSWPKVEYDSEGGPPLQLAKGGPIYTFRATEGIDYDMND